MTAPPEPEPVTAPLVEPAGRKPLVIQLAESTPLLIFVTLMIALAIYAGMRFAGINDDGPLSEIASGLAGALARGKLVDTRPPA
jgi:hypothetical protein